MEEYCVYVLYSEKWDRLYIGYSAASMVRFYFHNALAKKGFTIKFRTWKMIHLEVFSFKNEAMKREKQLKGGQGRAWVREVILKELQKLGFIR
jgi:putative endonuclease